MTRIFFFPPAIQDLYRILAAISLVSAFFSLIVSPMCAPLEPIERSIAHGKIFG